MENTTAPKNATEKSCCAPSCCAGEKTAGTPAPDAVDETVRDTVQQRYGQAVKAVLTGSKPSCCGSSAATGIGGTDPITRDLYDGAQIDGLPADALLASFGCGNP